jgi:hypothetical protein
MLKTANWYTVLGMVGALALGGCGAQGLAAEEQEIIQNLSRSATPPRTSRSSTVRCGSRGTPT